MGLAASPPQKAAAPVTIVQQPSPAPAPEALVICTECGARVSARSKFCPECGEKLGPKRKAESGEIEKEKTRAPKKILEGKLGFCMYCGTELPEGADFCPECGRKVK